MAKRRVKKNNVFLAISILLFVISICIMVCFFFAKKDEVQIEQFDKEFGEREELTKEKRMSLVAVGDALIHGALYIDAKTGSNTYDFSYMFTEVEPLLKEYDLKYYNQETIIGGKNLGVSHYPRFNSPDEIAENLVAIGFNLVSLANNHSMDKGEKGILYSVDFWQRQNDVVVSGQSNSFDNRNNIKIYEKNEIKYAFIAYTNSTNGITIPSGKEYLVNTYSDEQAKKDIESIRDKVDVVIVSMHWGEEYTHEPTTVQKNQAKYLSSLGVNLIIGSHPHVIMPVDYINDTLVIYSLGNFVSGQSPLGIAKTIGLMVGMDIVVKEGDVTFENLDYKLLYTYCTSGYTNYKVYPFEKLNNNILPNYKKLEEEYMNIVTREVIYD